MFKQIYFTMLYCVCLVSGSVTQFRDFKVSRQGKAMHIEGQGTQTIFLTHSTRKYVISIGLLHCYTHLAVMLLTGNKQAKRHPYGILRLLVSLK